MKKMEMEGTVAICIREAARQFEQFEASVFNNMRQFLVEVRSVA